MLRIAASGGAPVTARAGFSGKAHVGPCCRRWPALPQSRLRPPLLHGLALGGASSCRRRAPGAAGRCAGRGHRRGRRGAGLAQHLEGALQPLLGLAGPLRQLVDLRSRALEGQRGRGHHQGPGARREGCAPPSARGLRPPGLGERLKWDARGPPRQHIGPQLLRVRAHAEGPASALQTPHRERKWNIQAVALSLLHSRLLQRLLRLRRLPLPRGRRRRGRGRSCCRRRRPR
mmetsp:Transcript_75163/g.244393  ORF Transcript_75163/g.244393 Transcript_75163/m.244393 type:complete len:231 (-) Transcript_75163:210-902(-)